MIDLHMHTKYSDGQFNLENLLKILNDKKIMYASITDHNSVDAHIEFMNKHLDKVYKGKMISGVEIQTLVSDYLIEVLVYDYDVLSFKKYVDGTRDEFWQFHNDAYNELIKRARSLGLKYIEPNRSLENGYYCNMKFQDAIAACYEYNKNIVDPEILTNHLGFYRNEFQRVGSLFYVDNKKSFPRLEEVILEAHKSGGKVFLAHLDEYRAIPDKMDFLKYLITNYEIDGIECFHPAINCDNRDKYIKFCRDNNLLISAGSDFHGNHLEHRKNINTEASLKEIDWLK